MSKYTNDNGDIVGLPQDDLMRAIQQMSTKPTKTTKSKKVKDPNAPKRPTSAYMIWLNETRSQIRDEHCAHLTGRDKVKGIMRMASTLWKELDDDARAPYNEKFVAAQQKYATEKEGYVPSTPKVVYDIADFPEAPDGWSGPFEMKYLSKYVKGDDGKNVPVFKNFDDAVEFANTLSKEVCGGITKTARGYQLRVGSTLITNSPKHARTGLGSWVKGDVSVSDVDVSDKETPKAKKVSFADTDTEPSAKRGRGRPKGSKNKKEASPEPSDVDADTPAKRGRGRPKGSKNKKSSPEPTDDSNSEEVHKVVEISLDIGKGMKTFFINEETQEIYDPETTSKVGEMDADGKFVSCE